jgi:PadR family transcriptional regulator PadR
MRRRQGASNERDLIGGTLDMLILQVVSAARVHGLQIAQEIERRSDHALLVEQGSLYPALQRLEERGWLVGEWGLSDTNRRARFYALTALGRRQLKAESNRWLTLTRAVALVMRSSRAQD